MWVFVIIQSVLVFDADTRNFQNSVTSVSQINQDAFPAEFYETERECENALQAFSANHSQLDFTSLWSVDHGYLPYAMAEIEGMSESETGVFGLDCIEVAGSLK
jgi:hypothetical protein